MIKDLFIFIELKDEAYVPFHDHRGAVVALKSLTRKSCETYRYTAYGESLTTDKRSPWLFASKRCDPETGFYFFGRRYYSPTLGRWITPDPQGFDDGPNLYAYLHNRPLNFERASLLFEAYGKPIRHALVFRCVDYRGHFLLILRGFNSKLLIFSYLKEMVFKVDCSFKF